MDIIIESVNKLEKILENSGCSDGGVQLDVDPDITNCQFEKGACMTADFGRKQGIFTTFDPIRACTKISYMFGAPLDTPAVRGAACALINVAAGFFCLARTLHPCAGSCHEACRADLATKLAGKQIFVVGSIPSLQATQGLFFTTDPATADVFLIGGEGLIDPGTGDIIEHYAKGAQVVCVGPSAAGVARLNELEHWCPYGN